MDSNKSKSKRVSPGRVIIIAGAIVGLLIGSGFATGQEIMQYFVSYGKWGVVGSILSLFLFASVGASFLSVGKAEKFDKGTEIFAYYCGPKLGTFYDIFSNVFVYLSYIIMIAGAGATGQEQYGWPIWLGSILMMVLVLSSVLMGLKSFVNIIGAIMPVVIVLAVSLAVVTLLCPGGKSKPITDWSKIWWLIRPSSRLPIIGC